jgi:hypothetical protein
VLDLEEKFGPSRGGITPIRPASDGNLLAMVVARRIMQSLSVPLD